MMYSEFCEMVGFEVDYNAYIDIYEKMYISIDIDKKDFIKLLNIDAIKKSERYLKALQEKEILQNVAVEKIEEKRKDISFYNDCIKKAKNSLDFWKSLQDEEMISYLKRDIKGFKKCITLLKSEINELKFIYNI